MGLVHISVFGGRGRGMGLDNSRCPDAFALPSCAAASLRSPRLRLAGTCNPDG